MLRKDAFMSRPGDPFQKIPPIDDIDDGTTARIRSPRPGAIGFSPSGHESDLHVLRRNVLDERSVMGMGSWTQPWTAGERVAFDPLVTMAIQHIDALLGAGHWRLPWPVGLFGRAYITKF